MKTVKQEWLSFEWLVTLSSSFGMGCGAAFVFSIESVNPTVQFGMNWKVGAGFLIVAWLTFWGCRALLFGSGENESGSDLSTSRRRWFIALSILGLGGTAAAMAYSLRGVSPEKQSDVGLGVLLAAFFLSILSFLFFRTIRFLQADEKRNALSPEDLD